MTEMTGRPSTRLDPSTTWTVVTDSPLKGLALAREAGTILAWDEGNQLYLLSVQGESLSTSRVPNRVSDAAISDEGGLIAVLAEPERLGLLLLSADFEVQVERSAPSDASFVTIDPHGRYLAVGTRLTGLHFFNRYGKPAGRLETLEPLSHLCFVPGQPLAFGAAAFGMLVGIALEPGRQSGRLEPEILWNERLMSNVGRLALNGEGGMILASCYTLGIQRFDLKGRNEGSYHLGGTVSHAVPDFPGRTLAAATLEGELVVMNSAGNVRWRTTLPRPVVALEVDPLGRYLIYGHATGEIVRLDLFGGKPPQPATAPLGSRGGIRTRCGTRGHRIGAYVPTGSCRPSSKCSSRRRPSSPLWMTHRWSLSSPARTGSNCLASRAISWDKGPTCPAPDRILRHRTGLAGRRDRPPDPALQPQAKHHPSTRRQPEPAHPPRDQAGRFRPGPGPGARPDRAFDAIGPLGLEARAAIPDRRPGRSGPRDSPRSPPAAGSFRSSIPPENRRSASHSTRAIHRS